MKAFIAKYLSGKVLSIKAISAFTFSNIINSIVVFVSLGIYLKYLPPDEYGKAIFFSLIVSLLSPIISLNTNVYFWTKFYDLSKSNKATTYSSNYYFILLMSLILSALTLFVPIQRILPGVLNDFIYIIPFAAFLNLLSEEVRTLLIYQKKIKSYILFNNGITIIENILIVLLVLYYSATFYSRIMAWLIVLVIVFFIHLILFAKFYNYLRWEFSKEKLKIATIFGFPLMFQQWSKMVLSASDRWFLAGMVSVYQMGIYNLGYQIGAMVSTFISGYINFLTPIIYNKLSIKDYSGFNRVKNIYSLFLLFLVLGVVLLYLMFLLFAKQILGQNYFESAPYILFAGISTIIFAFNIPFTSALSYRSKNHIIAYISIVVLILNLVLNYLLIKRFLTLGAAYSTIISYSFLTLLTYFYYKRIYKI
jgi:O-antigen/teichoic acid export membrane protein